LAWKGFYGQSKKASNPNGYLLGSDFITNNQIPGIDFATVHSYPDQWISGSTEETQLSFLNNWVKDHIEDAHNVLRMPVMFAEFGKSTKTSGVDERDRLYNTVFSKIYSSASGGGPAVGGLFWQLLVEGMDSFRDGYEVILSEDSSTAGLIAQESQKLVRIRKMYTRLKNIEKLKKARDMRKPKHGN